MYHGVPEDHILEPYFEDIRGYPGYQRMAGASAVLAALCLHKFNRICRKNGTH